MMKRLNRWVAISAVLALAATTAVAAAVVTPVFTNDESAYAQYFQNSTDGCVSMSLEVFSSDSMTRYNDTSTALPTVRAQLFSYNYCTGEFIFMSGVDEAPALFTNKDLCSRRRARPCR